MGERESTCSNYTRGLPVLSSSNGHSQSLSSWSPWSLFCPVSFFPQAALTQLSLSSHAQDVRSPRCCHVDRLGAGAGSEIGFEKNPLVVTLLEQKGYDARLVRDTRHMPSGPVVRWAEQRRVCVNGEQQCNFRSTQSAGHQALNLGVRRAWNGGYWCDPSKSSRSCGLGGESVCEGEVGGVGSMASSLVG